MTQLGKKILRAAVRHRTGKQSVEGKYSTAKGKQSMEEEYGTAKGKYRKVLGLTLRLPGGPGLLTSWSGQQVAFLWGSTEVGSQAGAGSREAAREAGDAGRKAVGQGEAE